MTQEELLKKASEIYGLEDVRNEKTVAHVEHIFSEDDFDCETRVKMAQYYLSGIEQALIALEEEMAEKSNVFTNTPILINFKTRIAKKRPT